MKRIAAFLFSMLVFLAMLAPQGNAFGKKVLCLYKSSESQTQAENEIFFYLSQPLKELGLEISWWDIDRGIPPKELTQPVRAVITWFRGPSMANAETYLTFLESQMESGRKVVVIDNFGAYQDRKTGTYIEPLRLNTTLSRLGLLYQGDWTQDGSLISVAQADSGMVEYQGKQDTAVSAFYYRFVPADKDLKVWLSLKRKDRDQAPSPVIATNRSGGFALSRYLYRVQDGKVVLLLNPKRFLEESLFPAYGDQSVAFFVDTSKPERASIVRYAEIALDRAKIGYRKIESREAQDMVASDSRLFTCAALALGDDGGVRPEFLDALLKRGYGVVSLAAAEFKTLAPSLGIKAPASVPAAVTGYKIDPSIHMGEKATLEDKTITWKPGKSAPADGSVVLATDWRGNTPLAWARRTGQGRTLVWNSDLFSSGMFIGTIMESLLYAQGKGAAATAAVATLTLDDWPLPMYNVVKPPLTGTDTEFFSKTWWPDIRSILARFRYPVSSALVFNYNAQTSAPFFTGEFYVAISGEPLSIARETISSGGELGFHGYNHMSLTSKADTFNPVVWKNLQDMENGLRAARREWLRLFGPETLPRIYVAPHNVVSDDGIGVLSKVFPEIRVVATLWAGGGEETFHQFGKHPSYPSVYLMPRTSAGYHLSEEAHRMTLSSILGGGVFFHFFHADDVFDPVRSLGDSWPVLRAELEKYLAFVDSQYPWLEKTTVYEASKRMAAFDDTSSSVTLVPDGMDIACSAPGTVFRVRVDGPVKVEGGTILYEYKQSPYVVIRTQSHVTKVRGK